MEKMTDETNVPLRDEEKYPEISLDEQQLISIGLDNLKKMADEWEAEHKAYVEKAAWIKQMLAM